MLSAGAAQVTVSLVLRGSRIHIRAEVNAAPEERTSFWKANRLLQGVVGAQFRMHVEALVRSDRFEKLIPDLRFERRGEELQNQNL